MIHLAIKSKHDFQMERTNRSRDESDIAPFYEKPWLIFKQVYKSCLQAVKGRGQQNGLLLAPFFSYPLLLVSLFSWAKLQEGSGQV